MVICLGIVFFGGTNISTNDSLTEVSPVLTIIAMATKIPSTMPTETLEVTRIAGTPTPSYVDPTFIMGDLVEIFGTEGDGLRVREDPGLTSRIIYLGIDTEVFEIIDGPLMFDGYEWWLLQSPYNEARAGWAVGIFLRSIDS